MPPGRSPRPALLAVSAALAVWAACAGGARADEDAGTGRQAPPGPPIAFPAAVPAPGEGACAACARICSERHRFCVDASRRGDGPIALAARDAADAAWDAIVGVLGAPPPEGDLGAPWRLALADGVDGGGDAQLEARDPISRFDRASSVGRIERALAPGCALDLAAARAVARGALWRAAPATDEGSARAEAETLAKLATPCASGADDAGVFQAHPERTIVDPSSPAFDRGASMFFGWLDASYAARPGALVVGLWALAPTTTATGAVRWAGAPTGFDVLRTSMAGALWAGSTFEDLLVRFAIARASMTPPARLSWSIPWPAKARRLAAPAPVAPTGAGYVLVQTREAPAGAKLRVEAAWEDFGRMRWVVVKLDDAGRTIAELPITSLPLGTTASLTVEGLDGVAHVLVVGTNVGSTEHAFDPDEGEWEPHGWLLTLEGN